MDLVLLMYSKNNEDSSTAYLVRIINADKYHVQRIVVEEAVRYIWCGEKYGI
jgi:hypothetical protein